MSLLSNVNTFVPQMEGHESTFLKELKQKKMILLLPDSIMQDLLGVVKCNSTSNRYQSNFHFCKGRRSWYMEKQKQSNNLRASLSGKYIWLNFSTVVDSKLGQTQKNLATLFTEINSFPQPDRIIILFDEIDAIALDRTDPNDLREMGRATSAMLKGLDRINENIVLIATTNLYNHFDKALIRRFDSIINFNQYSNEDLMSIAEKMLDRYLSKLKLANRDVRLFRKIMGLMNPLPYPGDLKNLIRSSIAFSDPQDGQDYFRRLYSAAYGKKPENLQMLQAQNFTVREIEILTKKSKSSVARELKGGLLNE